MDEYIKRSTVLNVIHGKRQSLEAMVNRDYAQAVRDVYGVVRTIPTADVVQVRHGRWWKHCNERTCSICKFIYYNSNNDFNYCPDCGAKMDGKDGTN